MEVRQDKAGHLGVLIVGFNTVIREGLKAILAKDTRIQFIGDAPDEHRAAQLIRRAREQGHPVNVVLTETRNGQIDGVQVTKQIKDKFPDIAVLVLTENPNDSYVIDAIHAGAGGYIFLNEMTPDTLIQNILRVVEGETQMTTVLLRTAVDNLIKNGRRTLAERTTEAAHLTEREVDVLRLMGNGDSNKIIAITLGISPDTTKKHVRNIVEKLQVQNRTHAAITAAQAGIVGKPIANGICQN